jgi:hypothetical protein
VAEVYYPEAAALVQQILGPGAKVLPMGGHILRDEKPLVRDAALQAPARAVHNDFAPSFVDGFKANPEMAAALETHRLVALNLWRSVAAGPMRRMPLALCDRRTIAPADMQTVALADRGGHEIMIARYSPAHTWAYFPRLTREEVA